jgi:3-phenylpropionate/trans-cinnamate dioxygenase ferredoxin subunit
MTKVWSYAADADSIKNGEALCFVPEKHAPLAIFNVDGEFLCTTDTCTHEASSLSDGYIDGDTVECPFHFARFSLRTGAVLCPPAILPLKTFPVKLEDGKIYVDL